MSSEDATTSKIGTPEHLNLMKALKEEPWAFDFFSAARRLEAAHQSEGFGRSKRPIQDPVRFSQYADMAFSPRSVHSLQAVEGRDVPSLRLLFSGLFGPNGAMPYFMTEWIADRRKHHDDETLEAFSDIFHHRFFSLFYRAWADSDPAVALDKGDLNDVYATYLSAIGGVTLTKGDDFLDHGRRYYMGQIGPSSARPESLARVLSDHTGVEIDISEFKGGWLTVESEDQVCLGNTPLGGGQALGNAIYSKASAFEIVAGPVDDEQFEKLLPDGEWAGLIDEVVTAVAGIELSWTLRILRKETDIETSGLSGTTRLGVDSWMIGDAREEALRGDVVISAQRYE